MTDLFEQSDHRLKGAIEEVAQNIAGSILSKKSLFAIMEQLHGCTSANGSWTQRDAYDLLEAGLALHLSARSTPLLEDVPALSELVDSLAGQPRTALSRCGQKSGAECIGSSCGPHGLEG